MAGNSVDSRRRAMEWSRDENELATTRRSTGSDPVTSRQLIMSYLHDLAAGRGPSNTKDVTRNLARADISPEFMMDYIKRREQSPGGPDRMEEEALKTLLSLITKLQGKLQGN